jgi:hypothetical protein
VVGTWSSTGAVFRVGYPARLGGRNALTQVFQTHRLARIDDYAVAAGPIALNSPPGEGATLQVTLPSTTLRRGFKAPGP